ncbi:MAG: phosphoribosylglycinamide formyltransferase [Thermoplasmata archaeon]|nr:phosphoribosylglycinamide formyltransferase [Thermoplasmata archaeon]
MTRAVVLAVFVADRPEAPALDRARAHRLDTLVRPLRGEAAGAWGEEVGRELELRHVELVVLAGFLSILPAEFLARFPRQVVNVHPSLLPKYGGRGMYGRRVHEAVLRAGDAETGVSVHLVTDQLDRGPILWQERVPVVVGDTPERLRARGDLHPAGIR